MDSRKDLVKDFYPEADKIVKDILKASDKEKVDALVSSIPMALAPIVIKNLASRINLFGVVRDRIWTQIAVNYDPADNDEGIYPYPEEIMSDVREAMGFEPDCENGDDEIRVMSKTEVLDKVLQWNGIIGYGSTVKSWVQDIWNIDLDSMEEEY